jgi:signal transduction histidine kinase
MANIYEKIDSIAPQNDEQLLTDKDLYSPWKLTFLYGLFGVLWILLSDQILSSLVKDPLVYQKLQLYKGWFFIALTSFLFYSFASLNNNRVLSLNLKLQSKNDELWTVTEELIAMHDSLEQTIEDRTNELNLAHDELRKADQQDSMHQVVRSLLHRFNTPLGNAITYTDLLSSNCASDIVSVLSPAESATILSSVRANHKQIVLIMDTLKNMLEIDHAETPSVIHLSEIIPVILYDTFSFSLEQCKAILNIDYPTESLYLPEKTIKIALVSLTQFAKRQRENRTDLSPANLSITHSKTEIALIYQDATLSDITSLDEIIDPYAFNSFKTTNAGMELSILYNCVTLGLSGSFTLLSMEKDPILEMKIPLPPANKHRL